MNSSGPNESTSDTLPGPISSSSRKLILGVVYLVKEINVSCGLSASVHRVIFHFAPGFMEIGFELVEKVHVRLFLR